MEPKTQLMQEIFEQPEVLERLLREGRQNILDAAAKIREFAPEWVVIAARGSSDNAARYGQYLLGAHNHLGVGLAVPSLMTLYKAPPSFKRALVIGISQSGQSPDIVSVLDEARKQGGETLAITNDSTSPLARAAAHVIDIRAGQEKAVAATKTYTSQLLALAMLSTALDNNAKHWAELEALPSKVKQAATLNADLGDLASKFSGSKQLVVLGRGFNYSTAFEIALKIKETSYFVAEPYSVADLLHGPVAMIENGFPVLVIAPTGETLADAERIFELLSQRGARIVAISDRAEFLEKAEVKLKLPPGVPEWLSPIVGVVPGQLWAHALALATGKDPDKPRGLSKVTTTR